MICRSWLPVLALSLATCVWSSSATAEIKLPAVIGSDMVLQQGASLPIWGWAEEGDTVTVSIAGQSVSGKAGDDGRWQVTLSKLNATPVDKPLQMTIKDSSGDSIRLKNVLVGEVWVCSGQSNMEMGVGAAKDGQAEIAAANHPGIRLFWVPKVRAREPAQDLTADWDVCSPKALGSGGWGGFSAVSYFFGRDLHKELKVPVGLIFSAWSGTTAEEWTSRKALAAEPSLKSMVGQYEVLLKTLYNGMIAHSFLRYDQGAFGIRARPTSARGASVSSIAPHDDSQLAITIGPQEASPSASCRSRRFSTAATEPPKPRSGRRN